jgi:hypothetical protein
MNSDPHPDGQWAQWTRDAEEQIRRKRFVEGWPSYEERLENGDCEE